MSPLRASLPRSQSTGRSIQRTADAIRLVHPLTNPTVASPGPSLRSSPCNHSPTGFAENGGKLRLLGSRGGSHQVTAGWETDGGKLTVSDTQLRFGPLNKVSLSLARVERVRLQDFGSSIMLIVEERDSTRTWALAARPKVAEAAAAYLRQQNVQVG